MRGLAVVSGVWAVACASDGHWLRDSDDSVCSYLDDGSLVVDTRAPCVVPWGTEVCLRVVAKDGTREIAELLSVEASDILAEASCSEEIRISPSVEETRRLEPFPRRGVLDVAPVELCCGTDTSFDVGLRFGVDWLLDSDARVVLGARAWVARDLLPREARDLALEILGLARAGVVQEWLDGK